MKRGRKPEGKRSKGRTLSKRPKECATHELRCAALMNSGVNRSFVDPSYACKARKDAPPARYVDPWKSIHYVKTYGPRLLCVSMGN
jgi:hypothetical protein